MLVRKVFPLHRVIWYMRYEMAVALVVTVLAWVLYEVLGWTAVALPFTISAILGGALAIFLGFRNNSSYGRWWEARQLWGGIVNSSRVLGRLLITFTDSHRHQANYDPVRSEAFKKGMVYRQIAWVHALRLHLRGQESWEEVRPFLSQADYAELTSTQNKPAYLQLMMGRYIYEAMANGTLGGFDSFQVEGQLLALANYQGGCERIKNTPLLRQYHFFTKVFLYAFMLLLPFTMVADLHKMGIGWMVMPLGFIVASVFAIVGKVGEVNEDPFENLPTDVPMTAICTTIEHDLREMLGEKNLPPKLQPADGALY